MASIVFNPRLIIVLLLLFGLLYLVFVNFKFTRRIARQWATWARTLGCHEIEFGGFAGPWLCCRIDGLWIKVTEEITFFSEQSLVEVMAPDTIDFDLEVKTWNPWAAFRKAENWRFSEDFANHVFVNGQEQLVMALLSWQTRQRVLGFTKNGGVVFRSRLVHHASCFRDQASFRSTVGTVIEIARSLETPENLAARLLRNIKDDPESAVRLHNLEVLITHFPHQVETTDGLECALSDESEIIRFNAAIAASSHTLSANWAKESLTSSEMKIRLEKEMAIEDEAFLLLEKMATSKTLTDENRTAAIEDLGAKIGPDRMADILSVALRNNRTANAIAALTELARLSCVSAEGALHSALKSPHVAVIMAAAEILQAQGDVASVALLRAAQAANPLSLSLRRKIETAIESIQGRATAAEPGQLSLTAGEAGQLGLISDKEGQLSLEIDPDIQKDRSV